MEVPALQRVWGSERAPNNGRGRVGRRLTSAPRFGLAACWVMALPEQWSLGGAGGGSKKNAFPLVFNGHCLDQPGPRRGASDKLLLSNCPRKLPKATDQVGTENITPFRVKKHPCSPEWGAWHTVALARALLLPFIELLFPYPITPSA